MVPEPVEGPQIEMKSEKQKAETSFSGDFSWGISPKIRLLIINFES